MKNSQPFPSYSRKTSHDPTLLWRVCSRLVARSAVSGLSGGNGARSAASGRPNPRGSIPGGPRPRDQALALALYNVACVVVCSILVKLGYPKNF